MFASADANSEGSLLDLLVFNFIKDGICVIKHRIVIR